VKLYLAGSLFTQAERRWLRALAEALCAGGHDVFLPQDEAEPAMQRGDPSAAFEVNRAGIDACEAVVAVLDGADPDSGTAWECGYAFASGRPFVVVRTDIRGGEDDGLNLMLRRSAAHVVEQPAHEERLEPLVEKLERALAGL
jgi:nucleoside 2-deoxyribosyltransferase